MTDIMEEEPKLERINLESPRDVHDNKCLCACCCQNCGFNCSNGAYCGSNLKCLYCCQQGSACKACFIPSQLCMNDNASTCLCCRCNNGSRCCYIPARLCAQEGNNTCCCCQSSQDCRGCFNAGTCIKQLNHCCCCDMRCALPCDDDVPCMIAILGIVLYDSSKNK